MMIESCFGWVLHRRAVGDTSAWVTFFTREKGIVKARVRGATSSKKQSILQPFTPLWLSLRGTWVNQIEPDAAAMYFEQDALIAGFYMNELLFHTCHESLPEPELFAQYEKGLTELQNRKNIPLILRRFERVVLQTFGVFPLCHVESDGRSPIRPDQYYQFLPGEGFIKSVQGILGAHILKMDSDDLTEEAVLKSAKYVMRLAIQQLTSGIVFNSRALWSHQLKNT